MEPNIQESLDYLYDSVYIFCSNPILKQLCMFILESDTFKNAYGAKAHHHAYKGGLIIHTAEVVKNCMKVSTSESLLTAAIWHDYLKHRDYTLVGDRVEYSDFKQKLYHVSGSAMEFYSEAKKLNLDENLIDDICHCILSHHGRSDWGSPITPQTPEAWTLHWADCMSAWFENGKYKSKT